jgi:hypothetical protein
VLKERSKISKDPYYENMVEIEESEESHQLPEGTSLRN